jgi:hypothetical protein
MMTVFDGSCVVAIFPEGALSILATVIHLADAAGNKLHCCGNIAILFCGRYNTECVNVFETVFQNNLVTISFL